ncbi:BTAD domain-containing putative transcriptional regulator [Candidatus Bipolaricaulota bacterium]
MTSSLRLFGTPVLRCDGTPVRFQRRKAMALLAYLAVTRSPHHRESLATMLWPESRTVSAHSALRNLLWCLRTTPISEFLHSDRSTVELRERDALSVDVNRFRDLTGTCPSKSHGPESACAACAPQLGEAVGFWKGPFMSGYIVANSSQFDDWQFIEGEALKRELSEALDRMIEYHDSIEDWTASAQHARTWLRVDDLNESAYRSLIRALSAQGKRSEALQVFNECIRTLDERLSLAPETETVALAESLRRPKGEATPLPRDRRSRLPHPTERIIGRGEVTEQVEDLLLGGSTQAVNLVGLGGAGKTTLALRVGHRIEGRLAQGAAFVPLDTLLDEAPVASAIQTALGLPSAGSADASPEVRIADLLRDHELLLILDGAERFVPQALRLIEALRSSPAVRILATSRTEMSTAGVVSVPVHGLDCPPSDATQEHLLDYAAVRLLRVTAERHGVSHELDAAELEDMSRLARTLDGSPLGLEMAAGWRSILPWKAIADRVSENLSFLAHRDMDVAPKHRTLIAIFDQSWALLSNDGQAALRGLSVFRGPFTAQAAEHVADTHPSPLATLVNRCLLIRVGPDHYRMHELLRQFASKKLEESEDAAEQVRARHIEYYTAAVSEWLEDLKGSEQFPTLLRMEREIENIRVAFQSAATWGASAQVRAACEGLLSYYTMRTLLSEGESVFAAASSAYREHEGGDPIVEAFLRIVAGWFASWDRPVVAAKRRAEGMELLPKAAPTDRLHAMSNVIYAYSSFGKEHDENLERLEQSIAFYRSIRDPWGEASALEASGAVERYANEAKSEEFIQRSLRLRREIGDLWSEGPAIFRLAQLAEARGNNELALTRYQEALRLNEPYTRDAFGVISVLLAQARVTGKLGDTKRSLKLAEQALALSRETGYKFQIGRSLIEMARAHRAAGETAPAKALLEESFAALAHIGWHDLQACSARLLAEIAAEESDVGSAERWLHEAKDLDPDHEETQSLATRVAELRSG